MRRSRYAVKLGMALLWTLGPCLLFVPRGIVQDRAARERPLPGLPAHPQRHARTRLAPAGPFRRAGLRLSLCPGAARPGASWGSDVTLSRCGDRPPPGLLVCSISRPLGSPRSPSSWPASSCSTPPIMIMPGWRGNFDLSFARHTRIGLRTPLPDRQPANWRTANSRVMAGTGVGRRSRPARA